MKNTLNNCLTRFFWIIICLLSIGILFGSCKFHVMDDLPESTSKATVRLSIGQNEPGARTVIPSMPVFTKYVLSFTAKGGQSPVPDKEITDLSTVLSLDPGAWTITAKGYAMFNSAPAEVASGSTDITVEAGRSIDTVISISANMSGSDGSLGYTISVPKGLGAKKYELSYYKYQNYGGLINSPIVVDFDSSASAYSSASSVSLSPGYWVVTAKMYAGSMIAMKMEVVHVYSNMGSNAVFAFTSLDFMPAIHVAGTLTAKSNSEVCTTKNWSIQVYTDKTNPSSYIGYGQISSDDGVWSLDIVPFTSTTPLFIKVNGRSLLNTSLEQWISEPILVGNTNVDNLALSCDFSLIKISGTLTAKVNSVTQSTKDWVINAYTDKSDTISSVGYVNISGDDGTWSMEITPFASATPLFFKVSRNSYPDIQLQKWIADPIMVGNTNVDNVTLACDFSLITISGTIDYKIDGVNPSITNLSVIAWGGSSGNSQIGCSAMVTSSNTTWSMTIDALDEPSPVYFSISGGDPSGIIFYKKFSSPYTIGSSDVSDISLVYSKVTISGTLSANINGSAQDVIGWGVSASSNENGGSGIGSTSISNSNGTWSMLIDVPASSVTISFHVWGKSSSGVQFNEAISGSWSVGSTGMTGINLNFIKDIITLKGTLRVNLDGFDQDLSDYTISAYPDPECDIDDLGYSRIEADGSWILSLPPFSSPTQVYFSIGGQKIHKIFPSGYTVYNTDVTDIDLVVDNLITMSGTLNVNIDGSDQDLSNYSIYAYPDSECDTDYLGYSRIEADGTWIMYLPPFSSPTQVYFKIYGQNFHRVFSGGYTVYNSDVTDIHLVADNLITMSGTLNVNIDGRVPDVTHWEVSAYSDSTYSSEMGYSYINESGIWSMIVDKFSSPTPVYFNIRSSYESTFKVMKAAGPIMISNTNSSGVSLSINLTSVPLTGSVTGIANVLNILVVQDPANKITVETTAIGFCPVSNDSWELLGDTSMLNHSVYFFVDCESEDGKETVLYVSKTPVYIPVLY